MSTQTLNPSTFEGFYMKEGPSLRTGRKSLFYGKKQVIFPDGNTLLRANSGSYTYPVSGWYWFNSLEEACETLDCNLEYWEYELYGPHYEAIKGKPEDTRDPDLFT